MLQEPCFWILIKKSEKNTEKFTEKIQKNFSVFFSVFFFQIQIKSSINLFFFKFDQHMAQKLKQTTVKDCKNLVFGI